MELTKQVTSLELSQRLKELGAPQGSWESRSPLFYWSYYDGGARRDKPELILADDCNFGFMENLVAAFTVAELGEMLPFSINIKERLHSWDCYKDNKGNWEAWLMLGDLMVGNKFVADTEADARAKMLIYLLENNLITI